MGSLGLYGAIRALWGHRGLTCAVSWMGWERGSAVDPPSLGAAAAVGPALGTLGSMGAAGTFGVGGTFGVAEER